MHDRIYNVLFLCTGNSARSIIAEAILKRDGKGKFNAYSAGSQPSGEVNPYARELLVKKGHDISATASKSWDVFARPGMPEMDFVFTVCDSAVAETCPLWPGQPVTAHWGVPDPAAVQGSDEEKKKAFTDTYLEMSARISCFLKLPIAECGTQGLEERLREIGAGKTISLNGNA